MIGEMRAGMCGAVRGTHRSAAAVHRTPGRAEAQTAFSAIVWVYGEVEAAILPPYAPLS